MCTLERQDRATGEASVNVCKIEMIFGSLRRDELPNESIQAMKSDAYSCDVVVLRVRAGLPYIVAMLAQASDVVAATL